MPHSQSALAGMRELLAHRGPDGGGRLGTPARHVGFANRRLKIIDLEHGDQPMTDGDGNWITYNGEIYNYLELRRELGARRFSDRLGHRGHPPRVPALGPRLPRPAARHVRLRALGRGGEAPRRCARPLRDQTALHLPSIDGVLYCASEAKALLPFLPADRDGPDGLRDYLTFQFPLAARRSSPVSRSCRPAHVLIVERGQVADEALVGGALRAGSRAHRASISSNIFASSSTDSVTQHLRSDVPVGAYLSGGLDSSIVTALAARSRRRRSSLPSRGASTSGPAYDESQFARTMSLEPRGFDAARRDHRPRRTSSKPCATSRTTSTSRSRAPARSRSTSSSRDWRRTSARSCSVGKGATRSLAATRAISSRTSSSASRRRSKARCTERQFIVTYESIIPNLRSLRGVQAADPGVLARRGLRRPRRALLPTRQPRAPLDGAIDWSMFGDYSPLETFLEIFRADERRPGVVLRPHDALRLQDAAPGAAPGRGSGEHGARARVADAVRRPSRSSSSPRTLPALFKFKGGELKRSSGSPSATSCRKPSRNGRTRWAFPSR